MTHTQAQEYYAFIVHNNYDNSIAYRKLLYETLAQVLIEHFRTVVYV